MRPSFAVGWDAAFAACWVLLGWLMFIGRYHGSYPFLDLDSDTAQVASFAAALGSGDGFQGDYILGDPHNYAFYATVQIPVALMIARLVGDIGLAFILPLCVIVPLQGVGSYLLGRHVFEDRFLASLYAIVMLAVIPIKPLADYWGIKGYTTPRDWFQAFLPLLLLLVLTRAAREPWRFAVMALVGLMTYMHPVSTPHFALGVWFSLWFFLPNDWALARRLKHMLLYGATFALVTSFFALRFIGSRLSAQNAPPEAVLDVLRYRLTAGYTDIGVSYEAWLELAWKSGTLLLGLVGVCLLFALRDRADDLKRKVIGAWFAALVLGTVVIPVIDHSVARALGRLFLQFDFVRGIRYLFPLIWLIGFWGLAQLARRIPKWRPVSLLAAALFLGLLFSRFSISEYIGRGMKLVQAGQLVPQLRRPDERTRAMQAAAATPAGSKFLATTTEDALALRFFARRAVVYSYKDGGTFVYSNQAAMLDWRDRNTRIIPIIGAEKLSGNLVAPNHIDDFARIARRWGADHLFLAQRVSQSNVPRGGRLIFSGSRYSVIAL